MKAKNLKEWHKIVCSGVSYVCQGCKKEFDFPCYFDVNDVNQYVCGHHLETQGSQPSEALETENGVCVCKSCHDKIHRGLLNIEEKINE